MNDTQKRKIQDRRSQLLDSMPPDHMKNELIRCMIFSIDDGTEIDAICVHKKKNEVILTKVFQSGSSDAYQAFINALQTIPNKSNYLAKLVNGCDQDTTDLNSYSDIQLSQESANQNATTSTANKLGTKVGIIFC